MSGADAENGGSLREGGKTSRRGKTAVADSAGSAKNAIVVAGMHRSGTSAVTRTLSLVGCRLPKTLMPAKEDDNERGFWESEPIVDLNREILFSAGSNGNDWTPFNPEWKYSPVAESFRARALDVLASEVGDANLFVLKDPRFCRLLDFWLDVLQEFGATSYVVMPIRNPLEVAASMAKRDRHGVPAVLLLWLRSVLDAEAMSRGVPRTVIRFDSLLAGWEATLGKISADLGIVWPRKSKSVAVEVEAYLSPTERHFEEQDAGVLDNPSLSPWVKTVYEIMLRWTRGEIRDTDSAVLDEVRAAFDLATPSFDLLVAAGDRAIRRGRELDGFLAQRRKEVATLSWEVKQRDTTIGQKESQLAAARAENTRLEKELADRSKRLEAAERRIEEVEEARGRERAAAAADRIALIAEREAVTEELKAVTEELEAARDQQRELEAARAGLAIELKALRQKLDESLSRIQSLKSSLEKEKARNLKLRQRDEERREEARARRSVVRELQREVTTVRNSWSWRLTAPLRWPARLFRRSSAGSAAPPAAPAAKHPAEVGRVVGEQRSPTPRPPDPETYFAALAKFTGRPAAAVRRDIAARSEDVGARLHGGVVGEMVAKAAELEPLIERARPAGDQCAFFPFHSKIRIAQMVAMKRLQDQVRRRRARFVLLVPGGSRGAAYTAEQLAAALAELDAPEEVVVARTDEPTPWGSFPKGVRRADVAIEGQSLEGEGRDALLVELVRSLRPEAVFDLGSPSFWTAFERFGRPLSRSTSLHAYVLAGEPGPAERARLLETRGELLAGVLTDSESLAGELRRVLPAAKPRVEILPTPAPVLMDPPASSPPRARRVVRTDASTNIATALAAALPEAEVLVCSAGDDLVLADFDVWLQTGPGQSALLAAVAAGIPVVAAGSLDGLPPELVEQAGSANDVAALATALRRVLGNLRAADKRAAKLRTITLSHRTPLTYREALLRMLSTKVEP